MFINNTQSNPVKRSCGVPQGFLRWGLFSSPSMPPLCPPSSTVTVVTSCDNLKHHFYGDDSQVLNSALREIQIQTSKTGWHKTNFNRMAKGQKRCSSKQNKNCPPFLPTLQLGDITVPLSDSVKSPGVLLYNTLSMKNVISEASCYYFADLALCRSIFPTKLLICYCTSLLSGLPASCVHAFVAFTIVLVILKKKILYWI